MPIFEPSIHSACFPEELVSSVMLETSLPVVFLSRRQCFVFCLLVFSLKRDEQQVTTSGFLKGSGVGVEPQTPQGAMPRRAP